MSDLYSRLTPWYPLLDPPEDHAEEAALYAAALRSAILDPPERPTLLELGSGAGHNALFLKRAFACTLADLSPEMLALSQALNPDCEHIQGNMRTLRLDRMFDAVFVHDAVVYMTTPKALQEAIQTAVRHLRPGGAALFAPDYVTETFAESTEPLHADQDGRSIRGVAWVWDPNPHDTTYRTDYAMLFRDRDRVESLHDVHTEGLFPTATWLRLLTDAGLDVKRVPRELENGWSDNIFVGTRRR